MSEQLMYFDNNGFRCCRDDDPRCRRFVLIQDYKKLERELIFLKEELSICELICEGLRAGNKDLLRQVNQAFDDNEPIECKYCDGIGELPGDPRTNSFPTCGHCNGTGVEE